MQNIYLTEHIRKIETLAADKFNIPATTLMQNAGSAAFEYLQLYFPEAKTIAFFCGSGNNGGDGYVMALKAREHGLTVVILQVGKDPSTEHAREAFIACSQAGITIKRYNEKQPLIHCDLVVDAISGIGLQGSLTDAVIKLVERINESSTPVMSLDIPTGLNADTGEIMGAAIMANATVSFIGLKLGLIMGHGIAHCGLLAVADLHVPQVLLQAVPPVAERGVYREYAHFLTPRSRDWHKGQAGHVLVIGGAPGFSGAVRMAASGALRVGAGLVSVATHPDHAAFINSERPEIMTHAVKNPVDLQPLYEKATVVVLGPGLGQTDWSQALWNFVIDKADKPLVLDADGLNLLAKAPCQKNHWVITPHPGEAGRLLKKPTEKIQSNRLEAVMALQKNFGGISVLKGAGSIILAQDHLPTICDKGNPGMASGGMGDILSGVIAGLIAQHIPLREAATLGVLMHANAGDLAAAEYGERGLLATDLLPYLQQLSNPYTNVEA